MRSPAGGDDSAALRPRQWNEFGLARHRRKLLRAPSLLGALDELAGGGDEIPLDITRRGKGFTAQQ